jgi:hypothetical protein
MKGSVNSWFIVKSAHYKFILARKAEHCELGTKSEYEHEVAIGGIWKKLKFAERRNQLHTKS